MKTRVRFFHILHQFDVCLTAVLGYSAIQLQRYNPLPQSVLYGSLGEWLASAMQQIFDFPELKNATCIFPHSRWKYNWLLYTEEYVKCMKRQYNEFNHVFRIGVSLAQIDPSKCFI